MAEGRIRRIEMRIEGRVQGVFFRAETRRAARAAGATGLVRNLPDGSVQVIAEGTEDSLRQLRAFCEKGPGTAVVRSVEISWHEATGSFDDFEISH